MQRNSNFLWMHKLYRHLNEKIWKKKMFLVDIAIYLLFLKMLLWPSPPPPPSLLVQILIYDGSSNEKYYSYISVIHKSFTIFSLLAEYLFSYIDLFGRVN